jgi:diguanylate cyclase (GGDEF)-like protein/putative nucleotidyltransferase with HDIG domain
MYPPRLLRYLTLVIVASIPVIAGSVATIIATPPTAETVVGVVVFALAALAAEFKPVPLDESGERSASLAFVFLLASQVQFGWQYATLSAFVAMGAAQVVSKAPKLRMAFNSSVYSISVFLSGIPAWLLGWHALTGSDAQYLRLTALVLAGGAIYVSANVLLVATAVALYRGTNVRPLLEDYIRHSGPASAIMALISALAAALWNISPILELLLTGPLFALALYQRYAYRTVVATREAETDGLTLLGNHRSFHTDLREALAGAAEAETPLALALVDIDDFKSINDRYGHPVGDQVLQTLADLLRDEYGTTGTYRIGGEEFALLLPELDENGAYDALERLHERLWQTSFAHGEPVTVSAGIAAFPVSATDREELLRVADSALYWAKDHGKNRSCVYSPNVVRVYTPDELAAAAERHARQRAAASLIKVVDAKDVYAGAHSQSVSRLVVGIARAMDLDDETVEQVRLAGLLHDLGKIAVPDRILQKPGKLDADEMKTMREHAELGYRLLEGLGVSPVDRWIRHHHEWWDGSGYPLGLAGEDIPLGSRIILVADAFDAMTSDRVYRAAGSTAEAVAELRRRCWTQFDARVVAALERHLASTGELETTAKAS